MEIVEDIFKMLLWLMGFDQNVALAWGTAHPMLEFTYKTHVIFIVCCWTTISYEISTKSTRYNIDSYRGFAIRCRPEGMVVVEESCVNVAVARVFFGKWYSHSGAGAFQIGEVL